jgi:AcrR family transcriptional regulator
LPVASRARPPHQESHGGADLGRETTRRYAPRLPADQRRQQLLDAALRVIVERGAFNITIEEVGNAAGVTKPVVYSVFGTRRDLLQTLLQREQEQASAQVLAALPDVSQGIPEGDRGELLISALRALLQAVMDKPDRWRCILLPPEGTPPEVREAIERNRAVVLERIRVVASWYLDELGVPEGLDAELVAHGVLALVEAAGRLLLTDPERFGPERFVGALRTIFEAVRR